MTGTGGSLSLSGAGAGLPAPKVQTYAPVVRPDVFVADRQPSSGNLVQVSPVRYLKVTVPGIPASILADIAAYAPQVELLFYRQLATREGGPGGNGTKSGGYVHPSHGPGASGNGSFTHGGMHGGADPALQAVRPTEWPIASGADTLDVTQGILGFMCIGDIAYRDSTGNLANTVVVYPANRCNSSKRLRVSGKRFPYSSTMVPGYFAFRLSVLDLEDPRKKRVHGPLSQVVSCTSAKFPFDPAGLDSGGRAQANPASGFDPKVVNFWLGAVSRLPG